MASENDDLRVVLAELDAWIRREHPELHPRLRPALSERELGLLKQTLEPYHLTVELELLYRWHDGWDDSANGVYRALLPDASFKPLADAIRGYRAWWDDLGLDGSHPLWFPAFGDQSGELVALQLEPHTPAGQVYGYHSELELSTSYDSVAALFATALDLWRRGLLPDDRAYPEIRRVAAEHNPGSRLPDGSSLREISRASTSGWPPAWREAAGIPSLTPAAKEDLVTVAALVADPACARPIRAELKGIGGSADMFFATASDVTGSITVVFRREETENFREASGRGRYDLWLTPLPAQHAVDRADTPWLLAGVGADYLVTRVVPV